MNRIIYNQNNGVVAVIIPSQEAVDTYGISAIAQKDVPEGKPYKIVDVSIIPTDRSQREAWTINESELTDGVGSASNEFKVQP